MTYVFDPIYFNGTTLLLNEDKWEMGKGFMEYERNNQPIPVSYFPKLLDFDKASAALPDMFHAARGIIVCSQRARLVMDHWALGQVEFIPVAVEAAPKIAERLQFDSAYYFINVLGRAQRMQWLEMPLDPYPSKRGGG